MKTIILIISVLLFTISCSSLKDKVTQRMDDVESKPDWATLSKSIYKKDGKVYAIGFMESSATSKISALTRIADSNARAELSKLITNNIEIVLQNAQEGVEEGGDFSRYVVSESTKVLSQHITPEKRYWEKVLIKDEDGNEFLKLHIYSLVFIPENEMRKLVTDTLAKNKGISKELQENINSKLSTLTE